MRGWWLGVALLAGGCYQPNAEAPCSVTCDFAHQGPCPGELQCQQDNVCRSAGASTCPDAGHPDGPPIPIDSPSAMCHGNAQGLLRICLDIEPAQPLDLVATEPIQTDSDPRCTTYHQSTNPDDDVCLIQGTMIAIEPGVVISVVGFRPLVLYAASTLSVMGTIDASSSVANKYAHPGGALDCGAPGVTNGAGGEGGSFGSQGGDGGAGASESGAGNGGLAKPAFAPTVVRGGCRGTDGSSADTQENSKGGTGGGAVYMIANGQIFVSGTINASGSGGPGTGFYSGGGGGGSGGLVGLDAPMVTVSGIILANGGAGSSGGVEGTGGIAPGDDPSPSDALSPALGHPNTTSLSAAGGNGGVLTGGGMSGSSVGGTRGGGGGGGGVGYLAVYSAAFTAAGIVSPPASAP